MNTSLRHENDILHSKCSEARQTSERATMHLEFVRKQLDATRTELEKIRNENLRMRDEYSRSALDAQIQASAYKEENERLQHKISECEGLVSTLRKDLADREATLGPLQERVRDLEAKAKTQQDTLKIVEQTRQQWTQWTNHMLSKNNRIDPADFQRCKDECDKLKTQLQENEALKSTFEAQVKQAEADQVKLTAQLKEANQKVSKLQNIATNLKAKWKAAEEQAKHAVKPEAESSNAETSGDEKYQKLLAEKNQIQANLNHRIAAHTDLQKKHKDLMAKAREFVADKRLLNIKVVPRNSTSCENSCSNRRMN
ncbi:hypothetical protein BJV82DRAFT_66342 [Fennellomyces sp. T-0311]|nr:hypothetical protein BJV82DRAFT_66342 [Fennellomyces sp. T-0311]